MCSGKRSEMLIDNQEIVKLVVLSLGVNNSAIDSFQPLVVNNKWPSVLLCI